MSFQVFRDELFRGDNAGEAIATFGHGGDIIGEIAGVFVVADNDGALHGVVVFKELADEEADGDAFDEEEKEAQGDGHEGNDANRKEAFVDEEIIDNQGADGEDGGEKKAETLGSAGGAKENGLFIEAEGGQNNKHDWDEEDDAEGKVGELGGENIGAGVDVNANEIGGGEG